ncbi:hypothetical protein BH23CHL2_BH23CHL2_00970 [soil metagenome]
MIFSTPYYVYNDFFARSPVRRAIVSDTPFLAHIRSEVARAILSLVLILALAFTTHLFVNGYWAG